MRLRVEVLDATGGVLATGDGWLYGNVPGRGRAYFFVAVPRRGDGYRVTVLTFDRLEMGGPCMGDGWPPSPGATETRGAPQRSVGAMAPLGAQEHPGADGDEAEGGGDVELAGGHQVAAQVPTATATTVERSSAPAAPANTPHRLSDRSVAKSSVASWVLSPISASRTLRKIAR